MFVQNMASLVVAMEKHMEQHAEDEAEELM